MDSYTTAAQVAKNLKISRVTLWRWVSEGRFPPPVRLGERRIGFKETDLAAWEAAREPVEYAPPAAAKAGA